MGEENMAKNEIKYIATESNIMVFIDDKVVNFPRDLPEYRDMLDKIKEYEATNDNSIIKNYLKLLKKTKTLDILRRKNGS